MPPPEFPADHLPTNDDAVLDPSAKLPVRSFLNALLSPLSRAQNHDIAKNSQGGPRRRDTMQDERQIMHISVATDMLLEPLTAVPSGEAVRLIINVNIRPCRSYPETAAFA
jgi:hypothetical protein